MESKILSIHSFIERLTYARHYVGDKRTKIKQFLPSETSWFFRKTGEFQFHPPHVMWLRGSVPVGLERLKEAARGVIPELTFKGHPGASPGVRTVTWNPFSFSDVEKFSKPLAKWRWPAYPGWSHRHQDCFTVLSPFYKVWWHLGWIWTDSELSTPAPLALKRQTLEKEQVSVGGYIPCLLKTPSWILNDNSSK